MPLPVATSARTLLSAIQAQLASATGVTANRVLIVQRPDTPHFQGDKDILVRLGPPAPEDGFTVGAGRHCCLLTRQLQVTPRTRWATDESDRDDLSLLDEVNGHLALEEAVVDALHVWVPTDAQENWLTAQPLHWLPSAPPVRETPLSRSWVHTDLVFAVRYQLRLPTNNGY